MKLHKYYLSFFNALILHHGSFHEIKLFASADIYEWGLIRMCINIIRVASYGWMKV